MKGPIALITGASSGIGMELARIHAARGGSLVLVARRIERLEALSDELRRAHGAASTVIGADLSEEDAPVHIHDEVVRSGIHVDYLINNAGFGGLGAFHERPWADDRAMIQVNIVALAHLTHLFIPDMAKRGSGRIMQVASVAGFVPGPLQAMYYGSKAFVVSFSQALSQELRPAGVSVTALCPGTTATEFFDVAGMHSTPTARAHRMSANAVARAGYDGMLKGKPLVIPGGGNKLVVQALRLVPRRLASRISMELLKTRDARTGGRA